MRMPFLILLLLFLAVSCGDKTMSVVVPEKVELRDTFKRSATIEPQVKKTFEIANPVGAFKDYVMAYEQKGTMYQKPSDSVVYVFKKALKEEPEITREYE